MDPLSVLLFGKGIIELIGSLIKTGADVSGVIDFGERVFDNMNNEKRGPNDAEWDELKAMRQANNLEIDTLAEQPPPTS